MEETETEKFMTKKRKYSEDKSESYFYCPLCNDRIQYMLAYPHLKECLHYFEIVFNIPPSSNIYGSISNPPNSNISLYSAPISNPQVSNPPNSGPLSASNISLSSAPISNSQDSNPPNKPRERIIRDIKCAISNCRLAKQTPIYIKLNDRTIKLCAFSHIKSSATLETLNIKYPTDYISETYYCNECSEGINWLLKVRETATEPKKFERVKLFNFIKNLKIFQYRNFVVSHVLQIGLINTKLNSGNWQLVKGVLKNLKKKKKKKKKKIQVRKFRLINFFSHNIRILFKYFEL
jgi:hypothetical protein